MVFAGSSIKLAIPDRRQICAGEICYFLNVSSFAFKAFEFRGVWI